MIHQVIIPEFMRNELIKNYIPQTIKIHQGDTIRWINTDREQHSLIFFNIDPNSGNPIELEDRLDLDPGGIGEITFNYSYERIDYVCQNHRNEINSITIFTEDYENMSNTQRLRYLSRRYNIHPPDVLSHLDGTR